MKRFLIFPFLGFLLWAGCNKSNDNYQAILPSPDFDIHLYFNLFNGHPYYLVYWYDQKIFDWSALGFKLASGSYLNEHMIWVENPEDEKSPKEELDSSSNFFSDIKYNSLSVHLISEHVKEIGYIIDFRTFKDGLAFRYRFNSIADKNALAASESSEFDFDIRNQGWKINPELETPYAMESVLDLPMEFISDQQFSVRIFEIGDEKYPAMKLKQNDVRIPTYTTDIDNNKQSNEVQDDVLSTPWRILLISKKKSDE